MPYFIQDMAVLRIPTVAKIFLFLSLFSFLIFIFLPLSTSFLFPEMYPLIQKPSIVHQVVHCYSTITNKQTGFLGSHMFYFVYAYKFWDALFGQSVQDQQTSFQRKQKQAQIF